MLGLVLRIVVDPLIPPRGHVHVGGADAVEFFAKEPCILDFDGDLIFGVDSLALEKGPNGPFDVVLEEGKDRCLVRGIAPNPQEIIVP